MFDVLHPATSDDYDPAIRNPLWLVLGICVFLLCALVSFKIGIAVAIAAGLMLAFIRYFRENKNWQGAETWPVTRATVEFVSVRQAKDGDSRRSFHMGELAYSYSVNEAFYSGFCRCRFQSEKEASAFIEMFRGKRLPVRYNPAMPELSSMTAVELLSPGTVLEESMGAN